MLFSDSEEDDNEDFMVPKVKRRKFQDRVNFNLDAADFRERFRLTPTQADELLAEIGHQIGPSSARNRAMPAKEKLLTALRFLASGEFYYSVGDSHGQCCHGNKKKSVR